MSPIAVSRFLKKRQGIHKRVADELLRFIDILQAEIDACERVAASPPAISVGPLHFDDTAQNMLVRQLAFAETELQYVRLRINKTKRNFLLPFIQVVREGFDLFRNPNAICGTQCYRVESSFYNLDFSQIGAKHGPAITRLAHYTQSLRTTIATFRPPAWSLNFAAYIHQLIRDTLPRVEEDFAYFPPIDAEVGLSRCFADSRYSEKIDLVVSDAANSDPTECVNRLTLLAYRLIPDRDAMSPENQSIVLLLFFRVLFNRAYEHFSSFFCQRIDPDSEKLHELPQYAAKLFELPHEMLAEPIGDVSLQEVFTGDPKFANAAQILFNSIFHSNPIDTLYECHKCLFAIHEGALQNKLGERLADIEDAAELLSFDDLFSLFFAVMLVSGLPDFFQLSSFVMNFVPKNAMTPSFEYVLANLEALTIHSRKFKIQSLKDKERKLSEAQGSESEI
jgi:hypothetical protein